MFCFRLIRKELATTNLLERTWSSKGTISSDWHRCIIHHIGAFSMKARYEGKKKVRHFIQRETPACVHSYIEEFRRHYPNTSIEVKPRRNPYGEWGYAVFLNGERRDFGGLVMTEHDLRGATMAFRA